MDEMKNIDFVSFGGLEETYVRVPFLTNEMLEWLLNHEGYGSYSRGGHGIYFTREEDAVLFKLKWS
jgi:hypothetical protein